MALEEMQEMICLAFLLPRLQMKVRLGLLCCVVGNTEERGEVVSACTAVLVCFYLVRRFWTLERECVTCLDTAAVSCTCHAAHGA